MHHPPSYTRSLPYHLCSRLVSLVQLAPFVFSFKCNCKNMGKVTEEEFTEGLSAFGASTISQLKTKLSMAEDNVMEDDHEFYEFWKFCFIFLKDGEAGRKVPFTKCGVVMGLVTDKLPRAADFIQFMNDKEITHMNKDQWNSFVEFNQTVVDFDSYDETAAWPTLYDEFVDWVKDPKKES
eukprot:TRINITY_DN582_c3_g1_i2.p2 TRINITY_DN582_c3_g1~~TRINITY_DN582_c3_g1_i2.p2  ORF type:complete len:180 (+),score=47.63 TRINITY_DN582_c3_g1_i2:359-898(+)